MNLVRFQKPDIWNAFDQLSSFRDEVNRLFEGSLFNGSSDVLNTWAPALDVYEDKDNLFVTAELPGLKKEEIEISLHENTITVSGERRNEKKYDGADTARAERFFGRFTRSLILPKAVDAARVKASYRDGILTVTLPKAETARPRQIEVSVS